jgi:hypothetical protein
MKVHPAWSAAALLGAAALIGSAQTPAPLRPFVLPWDDATPTFTSLAAWTPRPAGAVGRVTANADGHFIVGGERIRFLGVNIGASSCFPPKDQADAIAGRLAKFGVNAVRFHHLEAPWEPNAVLIDYSVGNSRTLHPDRLDRLLYFISRLKAHGIYTNINLLVSRNFLPGDGLPPAIAQMEWKDQQALGFFNDTHLELQREHATQLLRAPNPYTGLPLAEDPAVAFVEILNEYGLFQAWHDRVLDTMPAVFRDELRDRWNAWLAERHASSAALLTAWGALDEPLGPNQLRNGTFAAGADQWNTERHQGAQASFTGTNDFTGGQPALRIQVTTAGSAGWHIQVNQGGHSLAHGQIYTVSFHARASSAMPLDVVLSRTGPTDYSTVQPIRSVTLGTDWREYRATFVASGDEPSIRLNFGGFGHRVGTVWLADVRLTTGGSAGTLPPGTSLETRTVPTVPRMATESAPMPNQRREWAEFLLHLERRYWQGMRAHVRDTLGYAGLVFGTIVSNSPPGIQAELDVVDSHGYWQHPQFPGNPWDPVNWIVPNVSMVNADGGTLAGIAQQRVRGRPHMITEYQHPSPNTYSAEGSLLIAAYGALQDWDGFWLFDYGAGANAWQRGYVNGFFAQDTAPVKMVNNLVAAALFRRGDVAPARHLHLHDFDDATQLEVAAFKGSAWSVGDGSHVGMPGRLALVSRLALITGPTPSGATKPPLPPPGPVYVSDTGELRWDRSRPDHGVVTIDTPRTKAVIGFIAGRTFDLGGFVFAPGATRQDWCTAALVALEGGALDDPAGARALLVVTGDHENTGQVWTNAARESVRTNWGGPPTLVEVVPLTLTVPVAAARVSAWALNPRGQRDTALPVATTAAGHARIVTGAAGDTLWYEIVIAPGDDGTAPEVTRAPEGGTALPGAPFALRVDARGRPAPAVQWFRDGQPLPGATGSTLHLPSIAAADAGLYHAALTNVHGTVLTRPARLVVGSPQPAAQRLINLSTRGTVSTGERVLIAGFVLTGTQPREVVIRAVGPSLAAHVAGTVPDPRLDLFGTPAAPGHSPPHLAFNERWNPVDMGDVFERVGAFPLATGSADAALRLTLPPGLYTAQVRGLGGANGIGLVEIYDATLSGGTRLVNLSTRGTIGDEAESLIAGFVVQGTQPKRMLLRAIGPALSGFGVDGAASAPHLVVRELLGATSRYVARNEGWTVQPDAPQIAAESAAVGAFELAPGSLDSALLLTLEPGLYTALVDRGRGTPGVGLVELYELP